MHSCQLGPAACLRWTMREAEPGPRRSNIHRDVPLATVGSTCSEMRHCQENPPRPPPAAAPHTYELELWLISEQSTRLQRAGLPGLLHYTFAAETIPCEITGYEKDRPPVAWHVVHPFSSFIHQSFESFVLEREQRKQSGGPEKTYTSWFYLFPRVVRKAHVSK